MEGTDLTMSSEAGSTSPPYARKGMDGPSESTGPGDASVQGHDAELAAIFAEMRRAVQLTQAQLAEHLLTNVDTVIALEDGAIDRLPDVAETSRVVATYAGLLGLDARPILRRIEAHRRPPLSDAADAQPAPAVEIPDDAGAPPASDGEMGSVTGHEELAFEAGLDTAPNPDPTDGQLEPRPSHGRIGVRKIAVTAMLLVLMASLAYAVSFVTQRPQLIWSVVDAMPDPIPRLTRNAWEFVSPLERAGGVGGTSDDPRSRKTDKLPVGGAPPAN